jgi:hypothetical protein
MGHMAKSLCAEALVSQGRIKVHNSNGTFCAVLDGCVYMSCANSKDRITGEGCGKFKIVNKYSDIAEVLAASQSTPCFRDKCVHWVLITKEAWDAFTGKLPLLNPKTKHQNTPQSLSTLFYLYL